MSIIPISLGKRSYNVHLGALAPQEVVSLLVQAINRASGVAVLMDPAVQDANSEQTIRGIGEKFKTKKYLLPSGESCKTIAQLERTLEWLAENEFDRDACIVCIGGGAVSDHAGFAAAIYQRGIRFASCPTTLLAMADASVGGKTAVNLRAGKNLAGAFHQPVCVVADLNRLLTLPSKDFASGLAEVVKCALIGSAKSFRDLESTSQKTARVIEDFEMPLESAIRTKTKIVTMDETEQGERKFLNFGHTLGHALEADSNFALLHGEAVALGMVAAIEIGVHLGVTMPPILRRVTDLLSRLDLPTNWKDRLNPKVIARLRTDKKCVDGFIDFVLIRDVAQPVIRRMALNELEGLLKITSERL